MTLSLAAVFIPLAFMPGLLGANFPRVRHHYHCRDSRLRSRFVNSDPFDVLADSRGARPQSHQNLDGANFSGDFSFRLRDFYSRSLDWFLDRGWIAAPIVIACALGVWFFFTHLPFTLVADRRQRDDSRILYRPGRRLTRSATAPPGNQLDPVLQANPAVDKYFTVAGRSGLGAGVFTVLFLKNGEPAARYRQSRG